MSLESFGLVRLDLGPLLQGQTRIAKVKSASNSLIIGNKARETSILSVNECCTTKHWDGTSNCQESQYEVTPNPKGNQNKGPKRKFVPVNRRNRPDNMQQFVQQLKKLLK